MVGKKYMKVLIISVLCVLELSTIFLMCKSSHANSVRLENVNLENNLINKDSKSNFAIMLGDKDGVYIESNESVWPSNLKYNYNAERSGCIDSNGNELVNVLNYDSTNQTVNLSVNSTAYCYLYFDLDGVAPQEFEFYLGGQSNPDYTNNPLVDVYINYSDNDISQYCVTEENSSENCNWIETSDSPINTTYTLSSGDGLKTVYAYTKDLAGNISEQVIDTTNLDTEKPTGNTISINNNSTYTQNTGVTLTLLSTGATEMCISNTESCNSWEPYTTSKSWTLTSTDGNKTVYVWYKDIAGNISDVVSDSITLDSVGPVISTQPSNSNVTVGNNATFKVVTSSSDGVTYQWQYRTSSSGTWSNASDTGNTTNTLTVSTTLSKSGYQFRCILTDAAGNTTTSNTVTLTVNRIVISTIPSQSGTLTYTGNAQSPRWSNYNSSQLTLGGTTSKTDAGTYSATFTPTANYQWSDGTTTAKSVNWAIGKAKISTVPSQSGTLTYTGSSQSPSWSNYNSTQLTLAGTTTGTNATTYTATFTPKTNYTWSDGTTTTKSVIWSIGKAAGSLSLNKSSASININATTTATVTRAGNGTISVSSSDTTVATATLSGTTITIKGLKKGTATITVSVAAGTNHTAPSNKTISVTVNRIKISTVPSQSGTLTYSGSAQSPSWSNYNSSQLTLGGTTTGTNAGTYTATFTPKTNYEWSDGTTTAKSVNWTIGKAAGSLTLSSSSVSINVGASTTVTVTRSGNGTVSATSNATGVATVSVSGTTITIKGVASGTATITVKVAAGTNHIAPSNKTVSVKVSQPAGNYILNSLKPSGLNTTMEGGLYRFQGTSVNNYICFGTSDKSTCTSNTDAYMYRIIGINSSGQLKLIKKEALNSTIEWWSDYTTDKTWPDSIIKTNINGSSFLSKTTYVPSGWSEKIATTTWKYGDNTTYDTTAANLYTTENGWTSTTSAKIGLMYAHDYYYAYQSGGVNCSGVGLYRTCQTAWIHLSQNDTGAPVSYEWTMSRYGYYSYDGYYYTWYVDSNGGVYGNYLINASAVRPVFYLTSDMQYKSGTGTIENPIILDTNPLVVNNVTASETTSSSITLNITTNDNDLVDTYYYKCGDSASYLESSSNTPTCSGLTADTSYNISVYVKDKFNHTSEVKTVSLKTSNPAGTYILNSLKPSGLNTTMEGGLYRFQGTNDTVNNYICFGTSDKSTCTGNTDAYMYRIIGINSSNQLKLIKKEALNSTMRWWSDYTTDKTWPDSLIKSNINGSSFLSNTTYVPSGWSDKIATTTWKYGDNTTRDTTAANLYSIENGWTATTSAKIGLMYLHDYYYAYQSGGLNCSSSGSYSTCKTAWIHLSQNDSGAPSSYEWTMSRYGYSSDRGYYTAWLVDSNGAVDDILMNYTYAIRPVFCLTSNVTYLSGTGTASDPILIS